MRELPAHVMLAAAGLHAATDGQGEGGPLVLPVRRHQEQLAPAGAQGGGREQIVAPPLHMELLDK